MKGINKSDVMSFMERVFMGITFIVLLVIYCILGGLLAYPYTIASGWSDTFFVYAGSLMPIVSLVMYCIYHLCWETKTFNKKVFWIIFFYLLSPIFYNLYSQFLGLTGFEKSSEIVFRLRFASLIIVPIKAFLFFIAFLWLRERWYKWNNKGRQVTVSEESITDSVDW